MLTHLSALFFAATTSVTGLASHAQASTSTMERPLIYKLHCEGCHMADGAGHKGFVPSFVGQIGSFTHSPEGRKFIIQVPGVSQSELSNREIADLMNWLLVAYDPDGLSSDFTPYDEREVEGWRNNPISDTAQLRRTILQDVEHDEHNLLLASADNAPIDMPASPPNSFALCGACHTTSNDSAHGMGPNLRGVIGRKAGTQKGFSFSGAMKDSGITWSEEELNRFLESPREVVPNSSMMYFGEADPAKRKEIIDYLTQLR